MIAFFLTIPINRMIPIKRDNAQVEMKQLQGENGAHARRRQRGKDR